MTVTRKKLSLKQRSLEILIRLKRLYPEAPCTLNYETPVQLLVATILSAQSTDARVNMVTPALFDRYPDAQALANAKPADIPNDGRQTPMRNHPVFVAQHATATCCRGCLARWHGIPPGRELTADDIVAAIADRP